LANDGPSALMRLVDAIVKFEQEEASRESRG
jgi:hypothetical protein